MTHAVTACSELVDWSSKQMRADTRGSGDSSETSDWLLGCRMTKSILRCRFLGLGYSTPDT